MQAIVGIAPALYQGSAGSNRPAQTLTEEYQRQTTNHLDQRQHGCAGRIVIKIQRLIDSQLDGGGLWPAAKRQNGGEAGEAQHKDECRDGQDLTTQPRPFNKTEEMPATHTQLSG